MTLFDGKPLTEEEVAARAVCECGHAKGEHSAEYDANEWCLVCPDCTGFVEVTPG